MRQERKKKPPTFPACVKAERNKICANSIRSRLRNEMEDSNNTAAKQTKILVSSLNHFQGDKGEELLDFIILSNIIFPRWRWWDDDSKMSFLLFWLVPVFWNALPILKQSPKLNHQKARHRNIYESINFVSLISEFSLIMNEKFKKQVCPRTQMQKANRGNVNYTSVSRTLHIKSPLIRHKIFRSCFLCTIIQFTDVLMQMQLIAIHFKHVTFQVHCANGTFRYTTLTVSVEYTNPGHQKHGWQPELWIHSEVNVGANCCTQIKYRSTQLTMLRLSWIWIFSQINTSIYTLEG